MRVAYLRCSSCPTNCCPTNALHSRTQRPKRLVDAYAVMASLPPQFVKVRPRRLAGGRARSAATASASAAAAAAAAAAQARGAPAALAPERAEPRCAPCAGRAALLLVYSARLAGPATRAQREDQGGGATQALRGARKARRHPGGACAPRLRTRARARAAVPSRCAPCAGWRRALRARARCAQLAPEHERATGASRKCGAKRGPQETTKWCPCPGRREARSMA